MYEEETIREETAHLDPKSPKTPKSRGKRRPSYTWQDMLSDAWDIGTAIPKGFTSGLLNQGLPQKMRGDYPGMGGMGRRKNWLRRTFKV